MSTIIVPPAHPLPSLAAPTSPPFDAAALTPAQQASLASLVAHFSSADLKLALPSTPTPELCTPVAYTEVLTEAEQFWLSEECLLRFLRATKWDEGQARDRLAKTLAWRREFGIEGLTKEYLSVEAETGKQMLYGFDNERRPIWYMRPALQNTDESERQLHQVFFIMTLAEHLMPRGVEKLDLFINFAARGRSPSMGTSKRVLYILQDHYPERLGTAYVINLPFLIRGFFKVISPLLDPVTRTKLNLPGTADLTSSAPAAQVETSFGGDVDFGTYGPETHDRYWLGEDGVCALAERRRRRALERWRALGGGVGRREWDVKEGEETW